MFITKDHSTFRCMFGKTLEKSTSSTKCTENGLNSETFLNEYPDRSIHKNDLYI